MKDAFSFTNRLRLGQAKGGLGFKSKELVGFHEAASSFRYESGHVGSTSISNAEV
jgi:hypothetical protein